MKVKKNIINTPNKFIVLSSQRTGSGLLEECISSHPELRCLGEILIGCGGSFKSNPPMFIEKKRLPRIIWSYAFSGAFFNPVGVIERELYTPDHLPRIGFRLMYNQMNRDPRVKSYISCLDKIKIIHLHRKNLLKQYVSLVLMHKQDRMGRKRAHLYEKPEIARIYICPKRALRYIVRLRREQKYFTRMFANNPKIEVSYEEMTSEVGFSLKVSTKITDFLNVPRRQLSARQVKVNPSYLRDYVDNYESIEEFFRDSDFSEMLD